MPDQINPVTVQEQIVPMVLYGLACIAVIGVVVGVSVSQSSEKLIEIFRTPGSTNLFTFLELPARKSHRPNYVNVENPLPGYRMRKFDEHRRLARLREASGNGLLPHEEEEILNQEIVEV